MRMMPEHQIHAQHRESTRRWKHIATYDVHCSEGTWHITSILVMALGNQPEAFASDLGDDQSHYLFNMWKFPSLELFRFCLFLWFICVWCASDRWYLCWQWVCIQMCAFILVSAKCWQLKVKLPWCTSHPWTAQTVKLLSSLLSLSSEKRSAVSRLILYCKTCW